MGVLTFGTGLDLSMTIAFRLSIDCRINCLIDCE